MTAKAFASGVDRRQFLRSVAGLGLAGILETRLAAALVAGTLDGGVERVIFESSFEQDDPIPNAKQHTLVEGIARTGKRSMMGQIEGDRQACFLEIPFSSKAARVLHVSYWVRSDRGSAGGLFVHTETMRAAMSRRIDNVPTNRWLRVEGRYELSEDCRGVVQIVAPSSHGAPAGRAWIDDVRVWETVSEVNWRGGVQDFPELAHDETGQVWMATLETSGTKRFVGVCKVDGRDCREVARLMPPGATGIAGPSVVGLKKGCLVAFAVEQAGTWRIAYGFLDGSQQAQSYQCAHIDCSGTANISPVAAVAADGVHILWESNADPARGIYACKVDPEGTGQVRRLSTETANSYNPAVVSLADGSLFAAWDSLRDKSADVYGASYRNGRWGTEKRVTSDKRIERHAALAVRGGELWMAWQMQSYPQMKLNSLTEQRIAVARIDRGRLESPLGLFEKVSPASRMFLRPRIAFDASGRLWLTARESLGQNAGWRPVLWSYAAGQWSPPQTVMDHQGRWRPVSLSSSAQGTTVACQYDDLPRGWDRTRGEFRDWRSRILVKNVEAGSAAVRIDLQTESLRPPKTEFSLGERIEMCAAALPQQKQTHNGEDLTLFWGDFHDHTDISVCNRRGNPPGHDLFANVRDIERLDFCALTDHGYNFDPPQWAFNAEQTRNNHDPGRFVTFLGQEWTSSINPPAPGGIMNRYGHRNLIFLDPYHKRFYDSFDGDISPTQLWREMEGVEFLCIPHQLADWRGKGGGNPPTDWDHTDEKLQPVAEIFQARQSYEYVGCPRQAPEGAPFKGNYLQDAWAKGIVVGVIASPDHGGGNGKVGVWAKELTREGIFKAVRKRHTFGTSGAKMSLFFSTDGAMMGDKIERPRGPLTFRVEALAMRPIKELVLFRNNEIVHRVEPGKKTLDLSWTDKQPLAAASTWYYARIHALDDELAWSSPIWFTG